MSRVDTVRPVVLQAGDDDERGGPEEEVAHGDEEESSVEAGESSSHAVARANHPGEGCGDKLALEKRLNHGDDIEHRLREAVAALASKTSEGICFMV